MSIIIENLLNYTQKLPLWFQDRFRHPKHLHYLLFSTIFHKPKKYHLYCAASTVQPGPRKRRPTQAVSGPPTQDRGGAHRLPAETENNAGKPATPNHLVDQAPKQGEVMRM